MEDQINDTDQLIATIKPVMADTLSATIRDSRDSVVEAIQPIMADTISASIIDSRDEMIESIDLSLQKRLIGGRQILQSGCLRHSLFSHCC